VSVDGYADWSKSSTARSVGPLHPHQAEAFELPAQSTATLRECDRYRSTREGVVWPIVEVFIRADHRARNITILHLDKREPFERKTLRRITCDSCRFASTAKRRWPR
jgi:hypothetical protein